MTSQEATAAARAFLKEQYGVQEADVDFQSFRSATQEKYTWEKFMGPIPDGKSFRDTWTIGLRYGDEDELITLVVDADTGEVERQ